ncbi:Fic family protein [Hymenobacter latericus]|uniref:Fic family protein n=1 Tax=Hymenobacter sp. YIM 151858-1 TaxID=2987688 RepID=UPI002225E978|nr:Fic family protein [Hymenobacter sp. YIM 151858-1]UYZ61210.1 Fic family protein [Hymenobacter sp. YIM 151858-1]
MADYNSFSQEVNVFHGRTAPEAGQLVGYGALIAGLQLPVPLPRQLALISRKHRQYETEGWRVLTPRHRPEDTLPGQLTFALKYEGIDLLFFKKLFEQVPAAVFEEWIRREPLGQYARRVWFLYEWLTGRQLAVPDLREGNYVPLLSDKLQYAAGPGTSSARHRIRNNLPGTVGFCPLIHRTPALEGFLVSNLAEQANQVIRGLHKDVLLRTSAFLLLKDSKASFTIEGENPTSTRAVRWGRAIGQAGQQPLSKEELLRLQQIVIENSRFVRLGYRTEGGFVGEHDRGTGEPLPDHISARWQDVEGLMSGLLASAAQLEQAGFHPVLTAAAVAFGFVFIHPFVDGNGRVHRYLIHHLLAQLRFTPQGIIFPVSAAILEHLDDYRRVLESYSHPLLEFIPWRSTPDHNVEVLADTSDYYRYFDATAQAEFLFRCVAYTLEHTIPAEVSYLQRYDRLKSWLDERLQLPDRLVALLVRFLEQNGGRLSRRAQSREFEQLTEAEVSEIEAAYERYFGG